MKGHLVLPLWFWLGLGTTCHLGLKGTKYIFGTLSDTCVRFWHQQ